MKITGILTLLLLLAATISAQQAISAAGTHATGTNVQLSWTVGEVMVSTFTGSSAILSQGLHQGKLTITAIEPIILADVSVKAYPNPVNDKLNIGFSNFAENKYSFSITDGNSSVIQTGTVAENPQSVDMTRFSQGIYFLKVEAVAEKQSQIFKVVKQ